MNEIRDQVAGIRNFSTEGTDNQSPGKSSLGSETLQLNCTQVAAGTEMRGLEIASPANSKDVFNVSRGLRLEMGMDIKNIKYLHPILFVLFPILSVYSKNVDQVILEDTVRITIVSMLGVVTLLVMVRYLTKSWAIVALMMSVLEVLFFSYGHAYLSIKNLTIGSIIIGRHRYVLLLWFILFVAWVWIVFRLRSKEHSISNFLFITSIAVLALPVTALVQHLAESLSLEPMQFAANSVEAASELRVDSTEHPDIYYIIVDGYGREDVLLNLYDYDNSQFLNFLRDEGFYVASESRSNYNQTDLSLSSSLNMTYLDFIPDAHGVELNNRSPLRELILHNEVVKLLREDGYQVVAFDTGYDRTTLDTADIFWDFSGEENRSGAKKLLGLSLNSFENLILRTSAMMVMFDAHIFAEHLNIYAVEDAQYSAHRTRILESLLRLREIPEMDGSYFVYAHIIAPHPPFVFGPHGEWITPEGTYTLAREGTFFTGSPEEYIVGYRGQMEYLNLLLTEAISSILENSNPAPIIILQGDHGPGAFLDQHSNEDSNIYERVSILNAYHFPSDDGSSLYLGISPVNTFRVVFNQFFQTNFEILEDRSYFSTIDEPYNFQLVTEEQYQQQMK